MRALQRHGLPGISQSMRKLPQGLCMQTSRVRDGLSCRTTQSLFPNVPDVREHDRSSTPIYSYLYLSGLAELLFLHTETALKRVQTTGASFQPRHRLWSCWDRN